MSKKTYYWDQSKRNIGVCVTERQGPKGAFLTFELLRSYRRPGADKNSYAHSFTDEHAEAVGNVITWALNYIRENRPPEIPEDAPELKAAV